MLRVRTRKAEWTGGIWTLVPLVRFSAPGNLPSALSSRTCRFCCRRPATLKEPRGRMESVNMDTPRRFRLFRAPTTTRDKENSGIKSTAAITTGQHTTSWRRIGEFKLFPLHANTKFKDRKRIHHVVAKYVSVISDTICPDVQHSQC
ncbi:hypothetical protein PGIGA_G00156540 [Pangasianodon gigas]|uniref:Uncharacterized protein n=1 Tax=Pangasianodon gigas TaxID=30993 RepID=A0ACC5XQH5_PANGG|nr:hypothetical protein [Pangasianodon gigas]